MSDISESFLYRVYKISCGYDIDKYRNAKTFKSRVYAALSYEHAGSCTTVARQPGIGTIRNEILMKIEILKLEYAHDRA